MTTFTKEQIALQQHIEARNAKWVAECKEHGATFYTTTVTDPAHWEQYGITNIEQYERYALVSSIWDAYKDVHGYRPRFIDFDNMSMEELQKMEDDIYEEARREAEWEREEQKRIEEARKAEIKRMIAYGAPNRETAIRWIKQAARCRAA